MLISWLKLEGKKLRSLDSRPGLGQIARIVESIRADPKEIVATTHTALPIEVAALDWRRQADSILSDVLRTTSHS